MKKQYTSPDLEVISLSLTDVLSNSPIDSVPSQIDKSSSLPDEDLDSIGNN